MAAMQPCFHGQAIRGPDSLNQPYVFMGKMKNTEFGRPVKNALELFFVLFFLFGVLLAGAFVLLYKTEFNRFLSETQERQRHVIDRQTIAIGDVFDIISGDLIFLVKQNELHSYFGRETPQALQAIQTEYVAMSDAKKIYDQIRFLDANGMEKVRVNFNGGDCCSVSEDKLQNKSERYYFMDTFALGKGELFISPLDLNVEQGKIEQPLKPMIRFGTPVFDDGGRERGIVLLNYLATNLLKQIESEGVGGAGANMLVNADGYWLLHPDKKKEWGFMFKDRAGILFANAYPREWGLIKSQHKGQVRTENGLFTFDTIYPLDEGYKSSSGSGDPCKPSVKPLRSSDYHWILVSNVSSGVIDNRAHSLMGKLFPIGAGLFILISYGAWHLALAVTKRRMYQAQLFKMALTDSLTGLPNRKLFINRLDEGMALAVRHGRKLGLLYIDLDGFKGVNDTMGHDAGDELLIQVGNTLTRNLRKGDTVARLGGDEFAVVLLEIKEPKDAGQIGEKVVEMLRRPFQLKAGIARIGASVGAAVFPDHENKVDALIKKADAAMYQAKSMGKNTCVLSGNALKQPLDPK